MSERLRRAEVAVHLDRLRGVVTDVQASRLRAIVALLAEDGRFVLRDALAAGDFPAIDARAQDAFQDFRKSVNAAAAGARVPLALELEARKTAPDRRHGWFTGGDLVEDGLVAFTGSAAARTGVTHPVTQAVAEVGASRRTRVYLSYPTGAHAPRIGPLLDRLRTDLALDPARTWEVTDLGSALVGENADQVRARLCALADARVALVTPGYLVDRAERDRVFAHPGPTVVFALSSLPDGEVDLAPLHHYDIGHRHQPWDGLTRADQRQRYVRDLIDEIRKALDRPACTTPAAPDCPPDEAFIRHTAALAERKLGNESRTLIGGDVGQTSLSASLPDRAARIGPPLPAVDRLLDWATDRRSDARRLCALLGDVGMGKTTTAKLFAQRLLDLHARDARVPLPILFDLRDVRTTDLAAKLSTDHILTSMLEYNRGIGAVAELTATGVRRRIAQGGTVVVFDGLDEVLVHLEPSDQRLFTSQMFRVVEERSGSKVLLTCRTQYFRTLREETGYFAGHDREGLRGDDYLALVMLPFRPEQVREYLAANLDWDDIRVAQFLDVIAAVHDLTDLARRPVTLRMIADQVQFIEAAKLRGDTVRAVDLYGEFVDRWLERDAGKHGLRPEHKRLLMEHVAARLWRDQRTSWGPDDIDDWLLEMLAARPDLQRRYRGWEPDLWTADFRTATFLSRDGDTFSFAHRSLFEYFLARFLLHVLTDAPSVPDAVDPIITAWALPVPSPETLDFLGQSLTALRPEERSAALGILARIGRRYTPQASELALAYALHAHRAGHPHPSLAGIALAGARLRGWQFGVSAPGAALATRRPQAGDQLLSLAGADFTGSDLRDAVFDRVDLSGADLSGADLTNAEFHGSRLAAVRLSGARAVGTILRASAIDAVDLAAATAYRVQVLCCADQPAAPPGWLVAPRPTPGPTPDHHRLQVLTGHTGSAESVAWSPDGTRIATGDDDGTVRVWDAATGEPLRALTGHTKSVSSVAWSPDGTRIATGDDDGTVRVWDAATGEPVRALTGHTRSVRSVAWSPDGTRIATSGDDDGTVRVWDAATGEPVRALTGHTKSVFSVTWSPDGTRIATGGVDGTRVWDAATGEPVRALTGHTRWVRSVAWSPDGTRIATGGDDGMVRVWDAATGEPVRALTGHTSLVLSVAWSPDGTRIATGGVDGMVRVWDAATGEPLRALTGHTSSVRSVAWSPDSTRIATGGGDGTRVWDAATGEPLRALTGHTSSVRSVAWSPDGTRIATGGVDGTRVWDAATGEPVRALIGHTRSVRSVAWSPDGTRIATGGVDGTRVWDAATGEPVRALIGHTRSVRSVAWSPDGTRIATGGVDGTRVWDAATGEPVRALTGHTKSVFSVTWSPDGTRIATGGVDGTRVWDAATGEPVRALTGHTSLVLSVAWSPDGTRIATGGDDGMVRVWDAATGEPLRALTGHTSLVLSVAWSPDGTRIATGGDDGMVRVWDAATGEPLRALTGHTRSVSSVAWSPDGTHLATGGVGMVRVWDTTSGSPATTAIVMLPGGEIAQFDAAMKTLTGATPGAWRWLAWPTVEDGRMSRLPAETYGLLPPLRRA